MKKINALSLIFLIFTGTGLFAQENGFIRGTVYDGETGNTMPFVTVFVEGANVGDKTDLDGKFNIGLPEGVYNVRFSVSLKRFHHRQGAGGRGQVPAEERCVVNHRFDNDERQ